MCGSCKCRKLRKNFTVLCSPLILRTFPILAVLIHEFLSIRVLNELLREGGVVKWFLHRYVVFTVRFQSISTLSKVHTGGK